MKLPLKIILNLNANGLHDNMAENSKPDQNGPEPEGDQSKDDRRKGIDRRWIKSNYPGKERRRRPDERRDETPRKNSDFDPSRL